MPDAIKNYKDNDGNLSSYNSLFPSALSRFFYALHPAVNGLIRQRKSMYDELQINVRRHGDNE